jgi:hypothetical protein
VTGVGPLDGVHGEEAQRIDSFEFELWGSHMCLLGWIEIAL